MADLLGMGWAILASVLSGILYSVIAYLKSEEDFDEVKFSRTLMVGAIVGFLMGYYGIGFTQAYDLMMSLGIIALIDQFIALLMKKYKKSKAKKVEAEKEEPKKEETGEKESAK
ncbi:MAG: hypothetical protein MUP55_01435 [Candidatus Aenigmarchaeota archaeon]|nr:hypothetical protein [Candidatus Aenigmarchaeota archaeon]